MTSEPSPGDEYFTRRLPPRPDPETGEPFPPHGLSYFGMQDTRPESSPYRETRLSHKPTPPEEGMGRVLAWHRENRRGKVADVIAAAGLLIVGMAVISLIKGYGLDGLAAWPVWLIIIVGTVLIASPFTYFTYSAGADWVQMETVRWGVKKKMWTSLYDLKKVDASYGGTTFHLWLWTDRGGFSRSFEELQRDRRIWDLVYNGILHSVASGAIATKQAIGILKLEETPALRLRRTWEIRHGHAE